MGWLKDKLGVEPGEPIECPRGWGQISFVPSFVLIPVAFWIEGKCPIGGVEDCTKCRHPVNPGSAEQLRQRLEELEVLRGSTLSEAEFRIRRQLIVEARDPQDGIPGEEAANTALILGPLGLVGSGVGWYLSATVSLGFMAVFAGGLVLLALAAGFTGISMIQRRTLRNPDDPLFEGLHEDTQKLEARLGRAQEELGFFRELHEGRSSEKPQPPDVDDS